MEIPVPGKVVFILKQEPFCCGYTDTVLHFMGSVQECSDSIANALQLLQSCTESSTSSIFSQHTRYVHHIAHSQVWDTGRVLTLNVQGPSKLVLTRSISCLLMPWLLASPGHQQPWYWLCRIGRSLSYSRRNFNYLCLISVEEWQKT